MSDHPTLSELDAAQPFSTRHIGPDGDARAAMLAALGCDVVWSPRDDQDWGARLRADMSWPVDVCVDTVASSSTLTAAVGLVGRAGTVIVVGFQAGSGIDLDHMTVTSCDADTCRRCRSSESRRTSRSCLSKLAS